jgi:precorrin-2 dehydrogenase/sirohydrochlorin ferrochelatase
MTTPLALDLALLPTALVGAGPALMKRLAVLDGEAVPGLAIYAADPEPAMIDAAGSRLIARWPTNEEIAALRVLFVAGLPTDQSAELAALARAHRVLVNVEDVLPLCDFHVPALLRRGDLALAIATGGASPTLSRRLKAHLSDLFPAEWADRIARIATLRQALRANGAGMREVMDATDRLIDSEGWLPPVPPR